MVRLKVKWKKFYNQINDYRTEAEDILNLQYEYCSMMDYDHILALANSWIDKCYKYLQTSFDYANNAYAISFYEEKYYLFSNGKNKTINEKKTEILQNLAAKKSYLEHILKILNVSDAVIHSDFVNIELRESFNLNEIIDLLFDKLFYLYDDYSHYPIIAILIGNGIKIKNYEVFFSQLNKLKNEGYINLKNTGNICGQLTLKGKEFIEKKRKFDFSNKVCTKFEEEFIETEQVDLFENIYDSEKCNDFMMKEIKELKMLNSVVFRNESNKLVVLMIKEDIFYFNPA